MEWGECIIVLFDPGGRVDKFGQFPNLIALSREGKTLWIAELPTTTSGDRYYRLVHGGKLKAASVFSLICEIDPESGRILRQEFVK